MPPRRWRNCRGPGLRPPALWERRTKRTPSRRSRFRRRRWAPWRASAWPQALEECRSRSRPSRRSRSRDRPSSPLRASEGPPSEARARIRVRHPSLCKCPRLPSRHFRVRVRRLLRRPSFCRRPRPQSPPSQARPSWSCCCRDHSWRRTFPALPTRRPGPWRPSPPTPTGPTRPLPTRPHERACCEDFTPLGPWLAEGRVSPEARRSACAPLAGRVRSRLALEVQLRRRMARATGQRIRGRAWALTAALLQAFPGREPSHEAHPGHPEFVRASGAQPRSLRPARCCGLGARRPGGRASSRGPRGWRASWRGARR
mmetsp:Transcript_11723/g.31413  ORF Transcript_11723/g.31413 Transcript_11723/m.31413 type:complete len:314 (+) Transcript_11723:711-1652(+)